MKIKKSYIAFIILVAVGIMCMNACRPLRNFTSTPKSWTGHSAAQSILPLPDPAKKTIFVIADHKLTEVFDMLAPYYLFNATGQANVYIVAKEKIPILVKKDLFVMPHINLREADSLQLHPDVIVIPALSVRDHKQDTTLVNWIRSHFNAQTKMLTICDGASTGAATGFYDGKVMTAHASDLPGIKASFSRPLWVQQLTVAQDGNLYSTAGVSNAVEGSLLVIRDLFGAGTAGKVAQDINYPYDSIKLDHQSIALSGSDKFSAARKVLFRKNKDIGVLLENGMNEFTLAAILDTYGRTFPASFQTFILHDTIIRTRNGLAIIHRGNNRPSKLDELHLPMPGSFTSKDSAYFGKTKIVTYNAEQKQYLFNSCLKTIAVQYGRSFSDFVRISLDYN